MGNYFCSVIKVTWPRWMPFHILLKALFYFFAGAKRSITLTLGIQYRGIRPILEILKRIFYRLCWNLSSWAKGTTIYWNVWGCMTKMAHVHLWYKPLNILFQNQMNDQIEIWYTASSTHVLPYLMKWWPKVHAMVKFDSLCILYRGMPT